MINCSDFLFFPIGADFFGYDKKSAYLYPIDILHYHIGKAIQSAYIINHTILKVQHFIRVFNEYTPYVVREHYTFIARLLFSRTDNIPTRKIITKFEIIKSLSMVPHIVVEVTGRCNFLCRYCYYGQMYNTVSDSSSRCKDMPKEECLQCLREILSLKDLLNNNRTVISFYGGEPFLNFRLIRTIVLFCQKEFPDIHFQFRATTNGSLLKKHIDFLVEHDFHLSVSLDGDDRSNLHRRYRSGYPSFTIVTENPGRL